MEAQAKFMKKFGWSLTAVGGVVFLFLTFHRYFLPGGPGSSSEFVFLVLLIVGVSFFVPGVLLGLLGQILAQLDERLRSLEEQNELRTGRSLQE